MHSVVRLLFLTTVLTGTLMPAAEAGVNSWPASGPGFQNVTAVEVDPADSRRVYVVSGLQRFSRSTDGGEHWYHYDSTLTKVSILSTVPGRPGSVYMAGTAPSRPESNVYLSTDYGTTWQLRGRLLLGESQRLEVDPLHPDVVYLGTSSALHKTTDGGVRWKSLLGSPGVLCFEIDRFDSQLVYVITGYSSLLRSTDGGMTWAAMGLAGFPRKVLVESLATDPFTPETVYVGTAGGGIYRSTDAGTSWKSLPAPVANAHLPSLIPHAGLQGGMYVVSEGTESAGLYRTLDGGATWRWNGLPAPPTSSLGVDSSNPSNIYLGTAEGLFQTTDAGVSWKLIGSEQELPQSLTGGARVGDSSHMGTASRLETVLPGSLNHDASARTQVVETAPQGEGVWLQSAATTALLPVGWTNFGPYSGAVGQAVVDPFNPGTVYFGPASVSDLGYGEDGVFLKSTDGGQSWNTWTTGRWWSLCFGASAGLLFRVGSGAVWKSTDYGDTWSKCASLPSIDRVIPDPVDPNIVWALDVDYPGLGSGAVWKSTDGGGTWGTVREQTGMNRLAIDPKSTGKVYVGGSSPHTGAAATLRSMDGGATWSVCGIRAPEDLLVDPERPGYVYFADPRFGILKSTDDGFTWTPANAGLPRPEAHRLAYDPVERILYCGVSSSMTGTVYKSTDAADSWQPTGRSLKDKPTSLVVLGPGRLVAGALPGAYWTTDAGATWHKSEDRVALARVQHVSVTPADPDLIYVATSAGLFRSDDAGSQWISINPELDPEEMAWSMAAAPTDGSLLLAAANTAVFLSRDRGDHWEQMLLMPDCYCRRSIYLAFAPDDTSTFYVTVVDASYQPSFGPDTAMYRTRDAGKTWTTLPIGAREWPAEPVIAAEGRIYILQGSRVWRSDDGGDTWIETADLPLLGGAWQLAGAPSNPSVLYVFSYFARVVLQSRDSGETWTKVAELGYSPDSSDSLEFMVVDPLNSDRAYLSADQLYLLTASLGSARPLGNGAVRPWRMAVVNGRRVLLVIPYSGYRGLLATEIPPAGDRLPRRQVR